MRKLPLAFAVLLIMGTVAVAQTYDQNQDTTTPSSTTSIQQNDSTMSQQTIGNTDATLPADQVGVNSPDYRPDYRGTELEKAYQQEPESFWQDPDITKSASVSIQENGGQ
jgi:hypothetical protein